MKLTDFSQLKKEAIRTEPMTTVAASPKKPVRKTEPDFDAAQMFAEFIGASQKLPKKKRVAAKFDEKSVEQKSAEADAREALEARIAELAAAQKETGVRLAQLERDLAVACEARAAAEREVARLKGDNARLRDELNRNRECTVEPAPAAEVPSAPKKSVDGLLKYEGALAEVFDGEVREQVVAALDEAQSAAEQSGRERRARILAAVLAENPSSGELERRRAELKQILKDAGSFADEGTLAALRRLGITCISGKKHWKLEYADIRMPMAKTPSDYRSAQNCTTDMANRYF